MIYKSKKDTWMMAVLIGVPVFIVITGLFSFYKAGPVFLYSYVGTLIFVLVVYFVLVLPISYTLDEKSLIVKSGLLKESIAYQDIKSVRPSRSLLSSPALSLDRLAIDHGKKIPTLISPEDKSKFLMELSSHTPHLSLSGTELS